MDETQGSCWKVKHLVIWTQTFNMTTPCQVKRKWKLVIVAEIVQDSSTRTWNRRGEKIGSEESSIRTWNRREKFTGSEESSRKVYRVRGFVDQEWKSSRKIYRVRGIVDQDEESSTGSEDLSTRGWNRRPGPRLHRPGPRIRRPGRWMVDENLSGSRNGRPGVEIVDQVRDFIDRVRGVVEDLSTRSWNRRPGPRIRRPGRRNARPGRWMGDENLSG